MSKLGGLVALAAVVAAGPVSAQILALDVGSVAQIQQRPGFAPNPGGTIDFGGASIEAFLAEPNRAFLGETAGVGFRGTTAVEAQTVSFANGVIAAGGFSGATAITTLDIEFSNPLDIAVETALISVIVPAGFGFYVTGFGCDPGALTTCGSGGRPAGFAQFLRDPQAPAGDLLATAGFAFSILSGGEVVQRISGDAQLVRDPVTGLVSVVENFGNLGNLLINFGLQSAPDATGFIGWGWDETPFELVFPEGLELLGAGETRQVSYQLETFAWTRARFVGGTSPDGLVAYSAFGDPVGRGGGDDVGGLSGIDISPLVFDLPEFIIPGEGPPRIEIWLGRSPTAIIPEPASWAMMIAGFGLAGLGLRHRRKAPAAA